jgi:hypothetical protein
MHHNQGLFTSWTPELIWSVRIDTVRKTGIFGRLHDCRFDLWPIAVRRCPRLFAGERHLPKVLASERLSWPFGVARGT